MQIEIRNVAAYQPRDPIELHSEAAPVIRGYAAVFNVTADLGYMRERIKPGAFSRAISEGQDVRALVNHDSSLILGRSTAKTLTLSEDATGLRVAINPPDTATGRDVMVSLKRGDLTQMSFAFIARKSIWIEENGKTPIRQLEDVDLIDVSIVAYPAYDDTSVSLNSRLKGEFNSSLPSNGHNWEVDVREREMKLKMLLWKR